MKILQINSVEGVGSTGRIATGIQTVAEIEGYQFINAYGRKSNNHANNIKIGTNKDIFYHVVLTRIFDKHGFGSKGATQKFIEEIKELNPDIIHLQNVHGYYLNIEILFNFLKKFNKPIVWSLHDCWTFTGHCSHFEFKGCNKWIDGCFKCPEKKSYPKSIFIDNSKNNYKKKKELFTNIPNMTIVTGSLWLDSKVKLSFLKDYKRLNIPTGIDLQLFKPIDSDFRKQYNLEDKFIILGVASVWGQRKGLDEFIKLSQILSDDEAIVLVGVNRNEVKKLPNSIITIERTNSIEELSQIYSAADVFANPTLEDTFPTTNLEAQACGTPVVTYRTGGSPESVDPNCGYVVPKCDIEKLYDALKKIKHNKKATYSKFCLSNSKKYDMFLNYNKYLDLYKSVLNG